MEKKEKFSVGIIGCGFAGGRFLRALIHRERTIGDVYVKAVCDFDLTKLDIFKQTNISTYAKVRDMLSADQYDIIILATNESNHYDVLCDIKKYSKIFKRLLVEKLLVETLKQAESIKKIFNEKDISVHFVERHSLVVKKLMDWIEKKELVVKRASFFWGKYRLHDHRPTTGVTSEISHPIDLILMISRLSSNESFEILQGSYIFSDYSCSGNRVIDTINVNLRLGKELVVNCNSSFLWHERNRRIILYLADSNGKVSHVANIVFDNPYWDLDSCTISEINPINGKRKIEEKWEIRQDDVDNKILCINKTYHFLNENIRELKGGRKSDILARLSSACYIQNIVGSLLKDAHKSIVETPIFGKCSLRTPLIQKSHDLLRRFIKDDNFSREDIGKWDEINFL